MLNTIIVAGLTAAITVVIILGAIGALVGRRSRRPREPVARVSRGSHEDPFAEAVAESLRRPE